MIRKILDFFLNPKFFLITKEEYLDRLKIQQSKILDVKEYFRISELIEHVTQCNDRSIQYAVNTHNNSIGRLF